MDRRLRKEAEKAVGDTFSHQELEEGINTIYLLETESEEYILKLHTNKKEGFSEGYVKDMKARFRAEVELYEVINEKTDIPSPEIVYTDFSEEKLPHQFYIMEKVEGENLGTIKNDIETGELADLMEQYGGMLGEIHDEIELDGYGLIVEKDEGIGYIEERETWREAFQLFIENTVQGIEKRWEDPPKIDIEEIEEHIRELPENPRPSLIHSDNRLENVLVENGEITGFLDWSFTRSGHRLYDLARAEYLLIDYDLELAGIEEEQREKMRQRLLNGYRKRCGNERYEEYRQLYRYATVLWILAGFPNWSSDWEEEEKESFRWELLDRMEKEKPV